jgi:WD40 repeat protein
MRLCGDRLLTGSWDASAKLWQFRSGGSVNKTPLSVLHEGESSVSCVDMVQDLAVSGGSDGAVVLYDLRTRQPAELAIVQAHCDAITALRLVADSFPAPRLVSCSDDGHVKVWDARAGHMGDGDTLVEFRTSSGTPKALLTDGLFALVGTDTGTVELWDLCTAPSDAILVGELSPPRWIQGTGDSSSAAASSSGVTALCAPDPPAAGSPQYSIVAGDASGSISFWTSPMSH